MGKAIRFMAYYKPYKKALLADLLFASLASIVVLIYPILVRHITNDAISEEGLAVASLIQTAGIFLLLMAIEYGSNFYMDYYGHAMGAQMESDMRDHLFEHYQRLSFRYYDNVTTGQLMSRATTDLFNISELAHHGPEDIVISFVRIIGSFVILSQINGMLTLTIFLILPIMVIFAYFQSMRMKQALKRNQERIAEVNSQIEDSLSGIRVVQSFANEQVEMEKFRSSNRRFLDSRRQGYKAEALFYNGLTAFTSFMMIAVVVVGAMLASNRLLLLPELITFLLYLNTLIDPVNRLVNFTKNLQSGVAGFERWMEMLAMEPDIADSPGVRAITPIRGEVEFADVGFRYDEGSNEVLSHIHFKANPGDYIALAGSSGVGKTTLCSLIPRFYEATEGAITIDGADIRTIELKSLRSQIGIVQQDVYLFATTIRENIQYGKPEATEEEMIRAATLAHAHEFIVKLPNGYDTYIGQRGVKLSGGQKQRISIARVFLKDPPILIFDEATSALDSESERAVQESLEQLAKDRTTFVIAHRLSTIRNAGRIIMLSEQGIAEEGTHSELLNRDGAYAKFYSAQFRQAQE